MIPIRFLLALIVLSFSVICLRFVLGFFGVEVSVYPHPGIATFSDRRIPVSGRQPVYWISNDEFLIVDKSELYAFNTNSSEERLVYDAADDISKNVRINPRSCFSEGRWSLFLDEVKHSESGATSISFDKYRANFDFKNSGEPLVSIGKGRTQNLEQNRTDCRLVEGFHQNHKRAASLPGTDIETSKIKTKFSRAVFSQVHAHETIVGFDGSGKFLEIPFFANRHVHKFDQSGANNSRLRVEKDRSSNSYLISPFLTDGVKWDGSWAGNVLIVDFDNQTTKEVILPAGPWDEKLDEVFGCFSCGCGCYRNTFLYLVNRDIYLHTNGRGFPLNAQGIFRMQVDDRKPRWEQVIEGALDNPLTFSPNGCRVAFAYPEIRVEELC